MDAADVRTGVVKAAIGALLRSVSLTRRSSSFRLTLYDLVRRTHWLRTDVAPFTLYRDWRDEQFENWDLDSLYRGFDEAFVDSYPGKLDRIAMVLQVLAATRSQPGDVAEFGVFRGHTALALHAWLERSHADKRLFLFDSFEGLPASAHPLDRHWRARDLGSDVQGVKRLFQGSPRVEIVPGFFADSLPQHPSLRFCFCHVDCDLYASTMECLEYLYPRLSPGGAVVFDDYGFRRCAGVREAVREFASLRSIPFLTLPTGQAIYFKAS